MKRKLIFLIVSALAVALFVLASASFDRVNALTSGDCYYTVENGEATITKLSNTSYKGELTIPSAIGKFPVTSIGWEAFYGCTGLTSITIPDSVTSIGYCAFSGCAGLTNITIGNSVTSIGVAAFNNCTGLTSIIIPDSVTSIGDHAFSYCSGLTSVTVGNSVTSIGYNAFSGCTNLKTLTIGNSVTDMGSNTFSNCSALEEATLLNGVRSIAYSGFSGCSSLKAAYVPASVTYIPTDAFDLCGNLTMYVEEDSYAHEFCEDYGFKYAFYVSDGGELLSGSVGITGLARVGQTLTADVSKVTPAGAEFTYRWYRNDVPIKLATGATYAVKYEDVGKRIRVEVKGAGNYHGTLASQTVYPTFVQNADTPSLEFTSRKIYPDDVISVELRIINNTDIDTLIVTPVLPKGFTLVGASAGSVFETAETGGVNTVIEGSNGEDGVVAVFAIKIPSTLDNNVYELRFDVLDCVGDGENVIPVAGYTGYLNKTDVLYGDATGDGEVTARDMVRLKKYLASPSGALPSGADVTGDGIVDSLDVVRLKRYFAEYSAVTQSSTVILGQ